MFVSYDHQIHKRYLWVFEKSNNAYSINANTSRKLNSWTCTHFTRLKGKFVYGRKLCTEVGILKDLNTGNTHGRQSDSRITVCRRLRYWFVVHLSQFWIHKWQIGVKQLNMASKAVHHISSLLCVSKRCLTILKTPVRDNL